MKTCSKCGQTRPEWRFNAKAASKDGLRPDCQECQHKVLLLYAARKGNLSEHWRATYLKHKYKLTFDELAMLVKQQDGKCALCQCELGSDKFCIDHNHTSGEVRGILCFKCNTGLGQFQDDPALLRAAAAYIENSVQHSADNVVGLRPTKSAYGDTKCRESGA